MHKDLIKSGITKAQCMEFGLLVVTILSFFALRSEYHSLLLLSFICALASLVFPFVWYPFAFCWMKLAHLLNRCTTFLILALLYFLLVIPIGYIKRLLGQDTLRLKQFKSGQQSVMVNRNHRYQAQDLFNTF